MIRANRQGLLHFSSCPNSSKCLPSSASYTWQPIVTWSVRTINTHNIVCNFFSWTWSVMWLYHVTNGQRVYEAAQRWLFWTSPWLTPCLLRLVGTFLLTYLRHDKVQWGRQCHEHQEVTLALVQATDYLYMLSMAPTLNADSWCVMSWMSCSHFETNSPIPFQM